MSLGLLAPMTSSTTLSSDRSNRKKRAVPQDDVVRRVQPKHNAKLPTSYRDLDDHVIYKRARPIDSSDTGEEDTVRKRMHEDEVEYRPSGGDDDEEYDDDEDPEKRYMEDVSVGYMLGNMIMSSIVQREARDSGK